MLNVFPKKSLYMVILLASTALTACGGGGGGSSFTVTTDTKSGTLPQIRPFVPDPTVPGFDASATEYVDTPTLRSMGLTPFYATGLSGSGISVGVLDSGIDGDHEELDGRIYAAGILIITAPRCRNAPCLRDPTPVCITRLSQVIIGGNNR